MTRWWSLAFLLIKCRSSINDPRCTGPRCCWELWCRRPRIFERGCLCALVQFSWSHSPLISGDSHTGQVISHLSWTSLHASLNDGRNLCFETPCRCMQKAFEGSVCFYILTSLAILFLDLPGACVLSRMDVLAFFTLLDTFSSLLFFSERSD